MFLVNVFWPRLEELLQIKFCGMCEPLDLRYMTCTQGKVIRFNWSEIQKQNSKSTKMISVGNLPSSSGRASCPFIFSLVSCLVHFNLHIKAQSMCIEIISIYLYIWVHQCFLLKCLFNILFLMNGFIVTPQILSLYYFWLSMSVDSRNRNIITLKSKAL